jgi:hypothetical protein
MSTRTGTDKIIESLRRLLPDFAPQPITQQIQQIDSTRIDLPPASGADYFFRLYSAPEMQIHAELATPVSDGNYFWYRPFESAAFGDSVEALDAAFNEMLEKLLTHETRIIQKSGWLNWHFKCEYAASDGWKRIYGHSALKLGGFKAPKIDGNTRIYRSSALVHGERTV